MVNLKMWYDALRIIPRISQEEWKELDIVSRWLIASRAAVFVMTAISVIFAALLTIRDGLFHPLPFILAFFGLIFAHATNNLLNDLTDFIKGVDKDNYFRNQYGPHPLEQQLLSVNQMWGYIIASFLIALACGIYLALTTPIITVYLIALGIFFIAFYTWPLKYFGLGELTVLIVWGPLMIGGSYYVISGGHWNWNVVICSFLYSIGPTSVLIGKHIDKSDKDRAKKIHTLPVILGETASRYLVIFLWIAQYILLFYLLSINFFSYSVLLVVLSLPQLIKSIIIFSKPRPSSPPKELELAWPLYFVYFAFLYNRRFGTLLVLALVIEIFLKYVIH
ncbi:MAG: prenyltransferase [Ignavibacteria bacterium]|nr:prenyltransferase [Ignavibacteria bacterium]